MRNEAIIVNEISCTGPQFVYMALQCYRCYRWAWPLVINHVVNAATEDYSRPILAVHCTISDIYSTINKTERFSKKVGVAYM